ncbi:ATP-binding protein [Aestuariirhabdus sp. Z084]|uniref:ATP-binding protein n=1 Tax=Aestuariirhabdus haliotis TaxID=2918751 RepID=UPI00201B4213|nr:ATP-binding protein [Aestuariirhabdus haliotis]MCL6415031.1 ATP-binding protein [Aestuariirhabdus haliotis]MCL6418963.1 ATP-binding protein [Aestuariirhabdus haliotis]
MQASIRQKIILFTVVPITLIYVVIFGFGLYQSQQRATANTEERLTQMAWHYASKVDGHMRELAQIARSTAIFLESNPEQSSQQLYELLRTNVRQSSAVYGAAIAFVPNGYQNKVLFAPYAYRDDNRVEALDLASIGYDYTRGDWQWWEIPQRSWQGTWTAPYRDATPAQPQVTTYTTPFYRNGRFRGVTTIDLKLDTINSILPESNEPGLQFVILNRSGDLVYSPKPVGVGDNLIRIAAEAQNRELLKLAASIASGVGGTTKAHRLRMDDEQLWISYAPIDSSDWALAVLMPESVALAGVRKEALIEAALLVISLLLIIASVWLVSGLLSQPIIQLQSAVRRVAQGQLDTDFATNSQDEIGVLARSFTRMSRQLVAREEALRQARENNLGRLVEGMKGNYFYFVMNQNIEVTYVSPSVTDTLGISRQDFIDSHDKMFGDPLQNPLAGNYARQVLAGDNLDPVELQVMHPDGQLRFIEVYAVPVSNPQRQIIGLEAIARDITRAKQTEQAVIRARDEAESANHAKSQFLANMSHELRTPLNGVLGYAQILQRERGFTSSQGESLRSIEECGQHLLSLINDILDLSKIESGDLEVNDEAVHLERVLNSVYKMVRQRADSKGLQLELDVDPLLPTAIHSDGVKLKQILLNLLANAVKFTRQGSIRMQVKLYGGQRIRFSVRDTGVGIEPEQQELIFSPFGQTAEGQEIGGTGLGLTISRRLVKVLGGELAVTSSPGEGSEFHFSIPLITAREEDAVEELNDDWADLSDPQLPPGKQYRVLVADDQRVNRDVLTRLLESAGFHTLQAKNGQQALDILRSQSIDLVLMDLRMPVMSGLEAIHALHQDVTLKTIPVIAVTASVFADTVQRLEAYGFNDYIGKPFNSTEVFHKIALQLGISYQQSQAVSNAPVFADNNFQIDHRLCLQLADQLQAALELGDIEAVKHLANQLRIDSPQAEELASQIEQLARSFDFENLEAICTALRTPRS